MAFYGFFNTASEWSGRGVSDTTAAAYDSDYQSECIKFGFNGYSGAIAWEEPLLNCWFHFRLYADNVNWSAASTTDGMWMHFFDAKGEELFRIDLVNGEYLLMAEEGGVWSGSSAGVILPAELVQQDIDIHLEVNDTGTNRISFYTDGVLGATFTTPWINGEGIVRIGFNHSDVNTNLFYSEVMIADEDTRGLRCATLVPDGEGGETDFTGAYTALANKKDVDGYTSTTAAERQSWTLSAYNGPASPTTIRGVFTQLWAVVGDTGPQNLDPFLRISATNYDKGVAIEPSYTKPVIGEWANDPSTTLAWNTADFASLEAGVESIT